jgi:hypothetical protein
VSEDINKLGIETQAELQVQGLDVVEERDGATLGKPASVNDAAPLSNGHDDGAQLNGAHEPASAVEVDDTAPGEPGRDETEADSDNLRVDSPCTDGAGAGDAPSAEAHAEKSGLVVPEKYDELIMFLYDELKFNVVPNNPVKKCPAVKWKELQDRRVTERELVSWYDDGLFDNGVGSLTGPISGIVVIDSDGPPGVAVLEEYEALHGALPKTLTAKSSGGRGLHRFFRHPGYKVTTRANTSIKLDIKGDKGYVALCRNGNPWNVVSDTLEIADLPEGLLEFIEAKAAAAGVVAKAAREKTREGIAIEVKRELKKYPVRETALSQDELEQYKRYADAAIKGEAEKLAEKQKDIDKRNETLFKAVCKLGWLIYHGIVDAEDVKAVLHEAFLKTRTAEELSDEYQVALDEEEFIDTFHSGLDKSKDDPLRDIFANRDHGAKNGKSSQRVAKGTGLIAINGDEIELEETTWIWENVIPREALSLIAGEPGHGKSQLGIYAAATVTTGGKWPSTMGELPNTEAGSVIIIQVEDHVKSTVGPRLKAAGADMSKVWIIKAVKTEDDKKRTFDLQADLGILADYVDSIGDVKLIIIDPVSAYMGKMDSHNNAEVRAVLDPIADFAEEYKVGVLGITHLNKGSGKASHRVIGSIAFCAAPRTVWQVMPDPDLEGRRLLVPVKSNIGKDKGGYGFSVDTVYVENRRQKRIKTSKVFWDNLPVNIKADEALDSRTDGPAVGIAKDFLLQMLKDPPEDASGYRGVDSKEVKRHATAAGISWATARRAQVALKIKPLAIRDEKTGHVMYSLWRLPVFGDLSE